MDSYEAFKHSQKIQTSQQVLTKLSMCESGNLRGFTLEFSPVIPGVFFLILVSFFSEHRKTSRQVLWPV